MVKKGSSMFCCTVVMPISVNNRGTFIFAEILRYVEIIGIHRVISIAQYNRNKSNDISSIYECYRIGDKRPYEPIQKTKDRQFDNFVVIGGTVSCLYDNLRCHQWQQSCQIDDRLFSVNDCPVVWRICAHRVLKQTAWCQPVHYSYHNT